MYRGAVMEPFLSPLLHLNLLMAELGVSEVSVSEANEVVNLLIQTYTSPAADDSQPSPSQRRRVEESFLTASQTSFSSQQCRQTTSRYRHALLLDAMEMLSEPRGLRVTRFTSRGAIGVDGRFSYKDLIPNSSILVFVDKRDPYFMSISAVPSVECRDMTPVPSNPPLGKMSLIHLVCCCPHHQSWRILTAASMPRPNFRQCVAAAICKVPQRASTSPRSTVSMSNGVGAAATCTDDSREELSSAVSSRSSSCDPFDPNVSRETSKWEFSNTMAFQHTYHEDPLLRLPRSDILRKENRLWSTVIFNSFVARSTRMKKRIDVQAEVLHYL